MTDRITSPSATALTTAPQPTGAARGAARRLRGRSRSVWASVALLLAAAAAGLLGAEAALYALGRPPFLASPEQIRAALRDGGTPAVIVAATATVLGLLSLWGAVAPGRTHRRALTAGRAPLVVDDAVLAGALSRSVGDAAAVPRSQVATRLGGRRARIALTPVTGFDIDRNAVEGAASRLLADVGAAPLHARIDITPEGRLS